MPRSALAPGAATSPAACRESVLSRLASRLVDVSVAVTGMVAAAPVLLPAMVAVRLAMGPPAIFRQTRPGLHGHPFTMLKLRTMTDERGPGGELLPDAQRLTPLGRMLRLLSIDELPQLWNVLRGEMSLVGPRPLLMEYLPRYTPEQTRRHEVRPGITGWAQVRGRNAMTWEERFALDLWYVDNRSLWLDLRILALTLLRVARREDINREGCATMPRFTGREARLRPGLPGLCTHQEQEAADG